MGYGSLDLSGGKQMYCVFRAVGLWNVIREYCGGKEDRRGMKEKNSV